MSGAEEARLAASTARGARAGIGYIKNGFREKLGAKLKKELGLDPGALSVNCSHCHGVPCADVLDRTAQAVKQAAAKLVPVRIGVGTGHEDRVHENRRLKLKDGRELVMPRYTEPEAQQEMILEKLNLKLPKQPPPRIRSGEVIMPTDPPT